MTFTLTIDLDNAAFDDQYEFRALLRQLTQRIGIGTPTAGENGNVWDSNGNQVGHWEVSA